MLDNAAKKVRDDFIKKFNGRITILSPDKVHIELTDFEKYILSYVNATKTKDICDENQISEMVDKIATFICLDDFEKLYVTMTFAGAGEEEDKPFEKEVIDEIVSENDEFGVLLLNCIVSENTYEEIMEEGALTDLSFHFLVKYFESFAEMLEEELEAEEEYDEEDEEDTEE